RRCATSALATVLVGRRHVFGRLPIDELFVLDGERRFPVFLADLGLAVVVGDLGRAAAVRACGGRLGRKDGLRTARVVGGESTDAGIGLAEALLRRRPRARRRRTTIVGLER